MENALLNAVVALVEKRPEDAISMFRAPSVGRGESAIITIQQRLHSALDKRDREAAANVLREILMKSMRLEPPDDKDADSYFRGVKAVEDEIEEAIRNLKS